MARIAMFPDGGINIERHAYCLCLHVRPATIFVALINLGGSLICACLTLFYMINNESKSSYIANRLVRDEVSRVTGISVLMYLLLALVSAMLLYGVIKSKPSYILPFFGIQFIDYLFTMPQFLASIYTHPYPSYYVAKSKDLDLNDPSGKSTYLDMRNMWPNASTTTHVYTTSLLFMTLILIFKTYFLCVVWKCYRYLHMKEFILPLSLHSSHFGAEAMMTPIVITQSNVPPPNYEEATKMPDYKPPEYRVAVADPSSTANVPSPALPADTATLAKQTV